MKSNLTLLAIVCGVIELFGGLMLLGYGGLVDALGSGVTANKGSLVASATADGFLAILFGILSFVFSSGIKRLRPWAWLFGICLYSATSLLSIILATTWIACFPPLSLLVIICAAIILFGLLSPAVRREFAIVTDTYNQRQPTPANQVSGRGLERIKRARRSLEGGDYITARSLFEESLQTQSEIGDEEGMAVSLGGLGVIEVNVGQPEKGVRLLGTSDVLLEAVDADAYSSERALYARTLAFARSRLGMEAFGNAWEEGRAMSLDVVTIYALDNPSAE